MICFAVVGKVCDVHVVYLELSSQFARGKKLKAERVIEGICTYIYSFE